MLLSGIISLVIFSGYNSDNEKGGNFSDASSLKNCGSYEYNQNQLNRYPQYRSVREDIEKFTQNYTLEENRTVVTIPVVFHVVYNTNDQNISDAQIMTQIDVLNKDFNRLNADTGSTPGPFKSLAANVHVQFCLAQRDQNNNATNGITRTMTSITSFTA